MQNRYSERRSYTRAKNKASNLYSSGQPDSSHLQKDISVKKSSPFIGAALIVVKTGVVVLSVIAKGIKATAKLLMPTRRKITYQDAMPHENEL